MGGRLRDFSVRGLALGLIAALTACSTSAGEGPPVDRASFDQDVPALVARSRLQPPQPRPFERFGGAVAVSERYAVVGAVGSQAAEEPGRAHVFDLAAPAGPVAVLSDAEGIPGALFGNAVAVSGETVVAGAPFDAEEGDRAGAVFVFERRDGEWVGAGKLVANEAQPLAYFGESVALHGDTLAVGAPGPAGPAVYLFERSGLSWSEVAVLRPSEDDADARFGSALDLEGERLAVGAWTSSLAEPGRAYVFSAASGAWAEEWVTQSPEIGDRFGHAVDLHGDLLAVSSLGGPVPPAVRVFEVSDGAWELSSVPSPEEKGVLGFGAAVAIGAGVLLVSAPATVTESPGAGVVLAYELQDEKWVLTAVMRTIEPANDEEFGATMATVGSKVLVGAPGANGSGGGSPVGAAFLFDYPVDTAARKGSS